jgi:hypothetical protein
MNIATLIALDDELEKIAFGHSQINKVLSVAKKLQLPKASAKVIPFLSGSPSFKNMIRDAGKATKGFGKYAPEMKDAFTSAMKEHPIKSLGAHKAVIMPGKTGHLGKMMRQSSTGQMLEGSLGKAPQVPAHQQKALHGVLKGHELDEATVPGRIGAAQFGHRSPDVIFREHNRLVTLPKDHEELKSYMRHFRQPMEGAHLFPRGMEYGSSPRLSRHARKHLTNRAERRFVEQSTPALEAAFSKTSQYNHSTKNSDCWHIQEYKTHGKTKVSSSVKFHVGRGAGIMRFMGDGHEAEKGRIAEENVRRIYAGQPLVPYYRR